MELEAKKLEVASKLGELERALDGLVAILAHSQADAQLEEKIGSGGLRLACEAIASINYGMEDVIGSSVTCVGAVGVTTDTLRRAQAVNDIKAEFRALCAPLRHIRVRIPVKEAASTQHISALRVILRRIQRSDLNLLAAYRKIPVLEAPPTSITYTRALTRSVYRKSVDEIFTLLSTKEGPVASADRARLESLNPHDTHLALVKERYGNVRANVVFARLDARGRGRIQVAAEMPILYARGRRDPPEITFAAARSDDRPRRARESKLQSDRFLESLPVYRYAY